MLWIWIRLVAFLPFTSLSFLIHHWANINVNSHSHSLYLILLLLLFLEWPAVHSVFSWHHNSVPTFRFTFHQSHSSLYRVCSSIYSLSPGQWQFNKLESLSFSTLSVPVLEPFSFIIWISCFLSVECNSRLVRFLYSLLLWSSLLYR